MKRYLGGDVDEVAVKFPVYELTIQHLIKHGYVMALNICRKVRRTELKDTFVVKSNYALV